MGNPDRDVAQVVFPRVDHANPARLRRQPHLRNADRLRAVEELAGERFGIGQDFRDRARRDDLAAARAGVRAEIDEIIGGADGLLVVLDHDDRVAEVAQFAQRGEQPLVVALVQADARLVENVEDAGELRADLRREPDALRLAAGKRAALAVEREVAEPDLVEKAEPLQDFAPHFAADFFLLRRLSVHA
jgi:hypothetical protein